MKRIIVLCCLSLIMTVIYLRSPVDNETSRNPEDYSYSRYGRHRTIMMSGDICIIKKNGLLVTLSGNGVWVMAKKSKTVCLSQPEINLIKLKCTNLLETDIYVVEVSNRQNCKKLQDAGKIQ